jgi:RNA polymerase sigma factor (sigma-70 family)
MERDRNRRREPGTVASSEMNVETLEAVVARARSGEKEALELVVVAIQDRVFGLSLRMLGHRSDAEDATQEILVKVITRLDSFRGESRFTTWVYAVASNHLRTLAARGLERRLLSFDQMAEKQSARLPELVPPTAERKTLANEVRLMCLHQLLVCLDREHRLVFVFGESLGMSGVEGAQVLGIEPAAFRKRLSRARKRMQGFMRERCGLVRASNACQCENWVELGVAHGAIDPAQPHFVGPLGDESPSMELDRDALEGLDELTRIAKLFREVPAFRAPEGLLDELSAAISKAPGQRPKA